ncbi:MAG: MBL fold metallo-hydrolase [Vicingus serpentipes]|nr:MBL fold metallo-hydrolase [Vicingus serpentipes]
MKITFLGTGTSQGIPVIACSCGVCVSENKKDKRLRTSIMVEDKGKVIVVDTGPDFRQQMLRENVKQLDAVVFTHEHKDHIAGLDDVRAFNYKQKRDMDIYATPEVQTALIREFHYAFTEYKYPGVPQLELHTIGDELFNIGGVVIQPINVWHHKMPVKAYRFGNFTYITDANQIEERELEKIKGSEILVINALRKESHISHFTLDEAIAVIEKIKPKKAYLIHISHLLGYHDEVEKKLPAFVKIAYDGLCIKM